jgi:putative DNA primase/helicase
MHKSVNYPATSVIKTKVGNVPLDLAELLVGVSTVRVEHPYLDALKLQGTAVNVLTSSTEVRATEYDDSAALIIYGPDKQPANVLLMALNANGYYEDVTIPGAPLAGCYGRIGPMSDCLLVVETFAAGLALHRATGYGVAVVLYAENVETVAKYLAQNYPDAQLILCAGKHEGQDGRNNMRHFTAAALAVDGLVAIPQPVSTFDELHRLHDEKAVKQAVMAAVKPLTSSFDHSSQVSDSDMAIPTMLWPNPVSGASLMIALIAELKKYIVMTVDDFTAMALWIFFTHIFDVARVSPVLAIRSPIKRCGKTSAMNLLAALVSKPYSVSNITAPVLYRLVNKYSPTLLLDESDTYLDDSAKMMTGILNSGHTRTNAQVARMDQGKITRFSTFCPKAIAGIGNMPSTLLDRSIVLRLRRKLPDEAVSKFVPRPNDEMVALRAQIARWANDNRSSLASILPTPANLENDRYEDNWEPLLAIAESLGSDCLVMAYQAARTLSNTHDEIKCSGEELLRDIQKAFDHIGTAKISTAKLIDALCSDREGPWSSYSNGKPITARHISNLLADFDITSKNLRFDIGILKGYERVEFEDSFARYVSDKSS